MKLNDLDRFDLGPENLVELDHRTLVIKKWNWDYALAHAFQRHCLDLLEQNPKLRLLICCNHPRVLTHGRGLQKPKKGETLELQEFHFQENMKLPYPLHKIERGGGLTFHHPGQFIFYPVVKLNPKTLSLSKMIDDIFDYTAVVLDSWGLKGLTHENKLLGLWLGPKKIASMGIAIEKLTTFHGMALNLHHDEEMKSAMRSLNPCGLAPDTYASVENFLTLPSNALEKFTADFLERISHGWK